MAAFYQKKFDTKTNDGHFPLDESHFHIFNALELKAVSLDLKVYAAI